MEGGRLLKLKSGKPYRDLKRTISIHILAFSLFDGERFRRAFSLCDEETGDKLCDDLRLLYIEVPKYVKHGVPRNRLEYWLLYLAGLEARKMPEPMVQDPMIGEALGLEKLFLQSEEERLRYLLSYKAMMDDLTIDEAIHHTARVEGLAEGRAEGEIKGRTETARKLLQMGLEPARVAEAASLTIEEVHALRGQADPTQ